MRSDPRQSVKSVNGTVLNQSNRGGLRNWNTVAGPKGTDHPEDGPIQPGGGNLGRDDDLSSRQVEAEQIPNRERNLGVGGKGGLNRRHRRIGAGDPNLQEANFPSREQGHGGAPGGQS